MLPLWYLVFAEDLLLSEASDYRFMTHGNMTLPGVIDSEEYSITMEAFETMGLSKEEVSSIHRVASAILHYGNLTFEEDKKEQALLPDQSGKFFLTLSSSICVAYARLALGVFRNFFFIPTNCTRRSL